MSQLTCGQRMDDIPLFYYPPTKTKTPAEAFQAKIPELSIALQPHVSPITDKLYANRFIASTIAYNITASHCTDYEKARKIVYDLLRQLQVHKNPHEYLRRICDLFDSLNDPILRHVTWRIMWESRCASHSTIGKKINEVLQLRLSIVGAHGSGKSTLVNSLLGKPSSWTQSSTKASKEYPTAESFVIWGETQDISSDNGYQQSEVHHLQHVKNVVDKANLSVYCIDMSAPFDSSAKTALSKYIMAKPEAISKTIIALTKANAIKYPVECQNEEDKMKNFEKRYELYTENIKEFLKSLSVPEVDVKKLPIVPTGDYSSIISPPRWLHAGRRDWSYLFWFTCMDRLFSH